MRAIVEPAAARLAADRRTEADLALMHDALDVMADPAIEPGQVVQADLAFHRALLLATHNDLLQRMELVIRTGLRARDELVHHSGGVENSAPAHRAVLTGVENGDAMAAQLAMEQLLALAAHDDAIVCGGPAQKVSGA